MKAQFVTTLSLIFSSFIAWGAPTVPECQSRPDFFSEGRVVSNLKALPRLVYVGKKADYFVENKVTGLKIWGEQSFLKGTRRLVCTTAGKGPGQSFSMYGPTIIDLSGEKNIGDSYWQFHMIATAKQFGIWNKASRIFSKTKELEKGLANINAQIQYLQLSQSEYQIVLSRETEQVSETLVIRFDAVSSLP